MSAQAENHSTRTPRKRRRGVIGLAVTLVIVLVLLVVIELIARFAVGRVTEDQLEAALPESVEADIQAKTTGWCVTCELIGGEISGLDIAGERVQFGEAVGTVDLRAERVQLDDPVTVGSASGSLRIGEEELNTLLADVTADSGFAMNALDLGDGTVGYETEFDLFGTTVVAEITADVRLQGGGRVQILAESLSLQTANIGADIPVDPERFSLNFCVAEYLPELLQITSVDIVDEALEINFRSTHEFATTEEAFQTTGSCT